MINSEIKPRRAFHITPSSNVDSILAQGLQPAKEKLVGIPDNLCEVGVFLFPDRETIADATWFFDRFDDDVALTVFAVDIEGMETFSNPDVGYEIWSRKPIPTERLTIVEVM